MQRLEILVSLGSRATGFYVSFKVSIFYLIYFSDEVNFKVLQYLHDSLCTKEYNPDLVVYIETTPEMAHERVKQRSRPGEENYSEDYLRLCHQFHEDMIDCYEKDGVTKVLRVNGHTTIDENVRRVINFILQ